MKLGVIIGRFQVPYLHEGHRHLIDSAIANSDQVLIILGCTMETDERNPYSFLQREEMILKSYPNVIVDFIFDNPSNLDWSNRLDFVIRRQMEQGDEVTLFGSRDSFITSYLTGIHRYQEVKEIPGVSGTMIRENLKKKNEIF